MEKQIESTPALLCKRRGNRAQENHSFILFINGKIIYKSEASGLRSLIFCLKKYRRKMQGAIVFDRVVGRAAALLLSYGGVKKIITPVISREAIKILERGGAEVEYGKTVKNIMNRAGTDLCPMEKLSAGKTAEELLEIL